VAGPLIVWRAGHRRLVAQPFRARRLGIPVLVSLDSGELVSIDDIRYGLLRRWNDMRHTIRTMGSDTGAGPTSSAPGRVPAVNDTK
jgi:hypothetical protein